MSSANKGLVRLVDGREVPSDSEAWRFECEARMLARIATTQARHSYVDEVARRRGKAVAQALQQLAGQIRQAEVIANRKERV
jgi:hypothetical protein